MRPELGPRQSDIRAPLGPLQRRESTRKGMGPAQWCKTAAQGAVARTGDQQVEWEVRSAPKGSGQLLRTCTREVERQPAHKADPDSAVSSCMKDYAFCLTDS